MNKDCDSKEYVEKEWEEEKKMRKRASASEMERIQGRKWHSKDWSEIQ